MTDEVINTPIKEEARDKGNGRFLPGNNFASLKKGKKHKINQMLLDRVLERAEQGRPFYETMFEIEDDPTAPQELKYKASAKVGDWVLNPNLSIMLGNDEDEITEEEIDAQIATLKIKLSK